MRLLLLAALAPLLFATAAPAQRAAIGADPPPDRVHPAGMTVLSVPTGGVAVSGVAYTPSGAGPHPVLLILHGLPGNEKNLDLAHAARRDGWVAVTFNYRGSWGSPGRFGFAHVLEDVAATLVHLRRPEVAAKLRADPTRIAIAGHSMGGWAALTIAARDHDLLGAVAISAADMGRLGAMPRAGLVPFMAGNAETLATTPAAMADEVIANGPAMALRNAVPGLARTPLLVLSSDDGLRPGTDALVAAVRAQGNARVVVRHVATDHGWSDHRIALQEAVLGCLDGLRKR